MTLGGSPTKFHSLLQRQYVLLLVNEFQEVISICCWRSGPPCKNTVVQKHITLSRRFCITKTPGAATDWATDARGLTSRKRQCIIPQRFFFIPSLGFGRFFKIRSSLSRIASFVGEAGGSSTRGGFLNDGMIRHQSLLRHCRPVSGSIQTCEWASGLIQVDSEETAELSAEWGRGGGIYDDSGVESKSSLGAMVTTWHQPSRHPRRRRKGGFFFVTVELQNITLVVKGDCFAPASFALKDD
ncbi:hypothetical protein J3A83DRAFT_4185304 [Scleroderma citrinum]